MRVDLAQNPGLARLHDGVSSVLSTILGKIDARLAHTGTWIVVCAALALVQLELIWTHWPWLDEWQALQIALQSPDLAALLENLRFEGHPPLWYLMLETAAHLGIPADHILPAVCSALALPGLALILFLSPFQRTDRLLLAGSEMLLLEFFTVSRSLTLGAFCVLVVAASWNRRFVPAIFIALLPICDFLFGVISVGLVWLRWRERRLTPAAMVLWIALSALAAWTVRPAPGIVPAVQRSGLLIDFATWLANFSMLGIPLPWHNAAPTWNHPPLALLGGLGILGFVALVLAETRTQRDDAIVIGGLAAFSLLFSLTVYPLASRHLMLVALALVLLVWRRIGAGGAPVTIWFRGWLMVGALCGAAITVYSQFVPFDTAHLAAEQIRRLGLKDKDWVAFPATSAAGIAPINGMMFERPGSNCRQDFIRWNQHSPFDGWPALTAWLRTRAEQNGRFYFVTELPMQESQLARRIGTVPVGFNGLEYNMFEIRPDGNVRHADSHIALPRCNGRARKFPV